MASVIAGFITRPAKEICNLVVGRIQHELDEGLLTAQTALRIAKERVQPVQEYIRASVPVKVVNEYDKVFESYKTMQAKQASERKQAKVKSKRPVRPTYAGVKKRYHVSDFAHMMRHEEADLSNATQNPHRAAASSIYRRAIDRSEMQGLSRKVSVSPKPQPKSDASAAYMKSLRILYPASDSYEERKKHADATLASILGPEHVHLGVGYASGHSGISEDPVLAEYSHNKNVKETLEYRQAWQADLRLAKEHEQRQKVEQEAEHTKKLAVLEHYCAIYDERVHKMVNAGGHFHVEIGQVLRAYDNGNVQALHEAADILINNTLEPIMALFEEMKDQIMLESMGAQELRNAWPTDSIEQVLAVLTSQILEDLPYDVQNALGYMLQSLRAMCQPIINAVPLVNPLNDPEPHVFEAKPLPVPKFEHYLSDKAKKTPQQAKTDGSLGGNAGINVSSLSELTAINNAAKSALPESKLEPPSESLSIFGPASKKRSAEAVQVEAPVGENAGKSYSSFAELAAASKSAKEEVNKKDEEAQKVRKRY